MNNNSRVNAGVLSVVQSIIDAEGAITASGLVESARPPESPAHDGFEWDDAVAGEEFRLQQARRWLRIVPIKVAGTSTTVDVSSGDMESAPMVKTRLTHVPPVDDKKEGYYKPKETMSGDEFGRALDEARRTMNSAKRAVDDLVSMTRQSNQEDKILLIAQVARGMDMMYEALGKM